MKYTSLSIVIPAHNESTTITKVVEVIHQVPWKKEGIETFEVIIINDGSSDNTAEVVEKLVKKYPEIKFFSNPHNLGKSQTVKRGISLTTGDLVVVQDADIEVTPAELLDFIHLFQNDPHLDVVYGNRFHGKQKSHTHGYWGNWFVTLVSNFFTMWRGFVVKDMEVCYKMTRGDLLRSLAQNIKSLSSFGIEPEITALFARARAKVATIDITFNPRTHAQGKHMKPIKDGLKAMIEIIRYNLL